VLIQPTKWNRWGNSLAGAIPAAGFSLGAIDALVSPRVSTVAAIGDLALVAAFAFLGVRGFRMRVQTTPERMIIYGMLRTRTVSRKAIVSIDAAWTSYAAALLAPRGAVPIVRWRGAGGRIRTTPISCLINGREPAAWRRRKEQAMRQLQNWAHPDEDIDPR
jgi:hypothetical protein